MRSHVINAEAGFAYSLNYIQKSYQADRIDCRVIIRHLGMWLKVNSMQSFDIAVMTIAV